MGRPVGEREVYRFSGGDTELPDCRQIFTPQRRISLENQHVRSGDSAQTSALNPADPRHSATVIGTDN